MADDCGSRFGSFDDVILRTPLSQFAITVQFAKSGGPLDAGQRPHTLLETPAIAETAAMFLNPCHRPFSHGPEALI